MSNRNFECKPQLWDKEYFGISSARVDLRGVIDEYEQVEILDFCSNFEFVTISNHNNVKENNYWLGCSTDAFLADVNIQFLKKLVSRPDGLDKDTYVENRLSRNEQILDISSKSFKFSRFFNDINLPREKADNIYRHWTDGAFGKDDKYFVVSMRGGSVAGFVLFSFDGDCSVIELIAVDGFYQGQGVGKDLVYSLESFVIDKGVFKIRVGTQIDNIAAAQFYSSMGFKYVGCSSVYHLWRE